ncbi:MAG: flavin reductase family protein [Anaerolineales bacterium]|nr:flavin reductase family protein [Anaerolineales bacterium]
MTIDPESLRTILRRWASGVTVVTSADGDELHGMTVSSFASVSLEPPLVLVCLERSTRTYELVRRAGIFAISILATDQRDISDLFAGRIPDEGDRLSNVRYRLAPTGSPVIEGSLGFLDCTLVAHHEAGTHSVFIGQVESAEVLEQGAPLLYFDRNYRSLEGD